MSKKREKKFYIYNCSVTEKSFKLTREAPRPDDLVSIDAYYEMNPEDDDRPDHIKKQKKSD